MNYLKYFPPNIVNLAAQSVRYSLENPDAYIESNIIGFMNILESLGITMFKGLSMHQVHLSMVGIKNSVF